MAKIDGNVAIIGGVTIIVLVAGWYLTNKAGQAAGAVVETVSKAADAAVETVKEAAPYVNPVDDRNIAYGAVNAIGAALTGDQKFKFGVWLHEKWNPPETEDERIARLIQERTGITNGKEWGVDTGAGW